MEPPQRQPREDLRPLVALFAFYLLVLAAWRSSGRFDAFSLVVATVAFVLLAMWAGWLRVARPTPPLLALAGLLGLLALVGFLTVEPMYYAVRPEGTVTRLVGAGAAALLVSGWVVRSRRLGIGLVVAAAAAFGLYLAAQLARSPAPIMDVWSISGEATRALLHGQDPYTQTYTDVYKEFGIRGYGYVPIFIYLPGLLLQFAPAAALGLDVRWVSLLAMAAGVLTLGLLVRARRDEAPTGWWAAVPAAACFLFWFQGGQAFLLEQAWPESLIVLYLSLAACFWSASPLAAGVVLVLALTLKQTTWFCAPFLLALIVAQRRWRMAAGVALGVAAVVAPFFLWDPGAFFHNVVVDLLQKAPRVDSMSWASVALQTCPRAVPAAMAVSLLLYAFALWRLIRHLRRAGPDPLRTTILWTAIGLLGFFLFLKQSFYNYYYLVAGLLALYACLPSEAPTDAPARSHRGPQR